MNKRKKEHTVERNREMMTRCQSKTIENETGETSPSRLRRRSLIVLAAAWVVLPLAGCGRKASPKEPKGSKYPREYPTQ